MQQADRFRLFSEDAPRIGVIIGTGPSLTDYQVKLAQSARDKDKCKLFGVNNAIEFDLDVHLACNPDWWDYYHEDTKHWPCHKWTWDKPSADKYKLNHIKGRWADGLSTDPEWIHYHHGSGPQIVNLAYHYGCETILLIGWDMAYREKRHYFGEYPEPLRHFPRTGSNGEFTGLIKEMETIKPEDYGIRIVNCTEGSAMKCYPFGKLGEYL